MGMLGDIQVSVSPSSLFSSFSIASINPLIFSISVRRWFQSTPRWVTDFGSAKAVTLSRAGSSTAESRSPIEHFSKLPKRKKNPIGVLKL